MDWYDFAAGCIGGSAGIFVGYPLDTVKVNVQTEGNLKIFSSIIRTYSHQGVRGFFKGLSFPLISSGIINGIFFGAYGNTLRFLASLRTPPQGCHPHYWDITLAGCVGGVVQLSVAVPVDLVKVKLQSQLTDNKIFRGPVHCLVQQYKLWGIRGCYQGFWIQAIRDVPAFGVYMLVYEWLMQILPNQSGTSSLFAGGIAGVISWAIILPLDVIKSRIQVDNISAPRYKGIRDCAITSYRVNGLAVFGRGFTTVALRSFPTNAVTLYVYSSMMFLFNQPCV